MLHMTRDNIYLMVINSMWLIICLQIKTFLYYPIVLLWSILMHSMEKLKKVNKACSN